MFSFLLPFASKIISDAVSKIPDDAELGDQLIDICLLVLEKAVKTDAKYVALLGSKRKAILIYESLLKKGISEERLREVRSPAGLDIGARTPNEIAVSIVAEMISFRNNSSSMPMKLDEKLFKKIISNSKS